MPTYTGQRGTGFTSLKQYLGLNEDGAKRLGESLYEDVNSAGQRATDAINRGRSDFEAKVAAGTPDAFEEVESADEATKRAEAAKYGGPDAWEPSSSTYQQIQDAQARSRALGSDAGRAALLSERTAGNAGYTPGSVGLDSFLAGRGMGDKAQQSRSQWAGLNDYLGLQRGQAADAVNKAKASADATSGQYSALAKGIKDKEVVAAAQAARAEQQKKYEQSTGKKVEEVRREAAGPSYDYEEMKGRNGNGGRRDPMYDGPVGYAPHLTARSSDGNIDDTSGGYYTPDGVYHPPPRRNP